MAKLCSAYFSSNGSWVAPAGVTRVWVFAHGGGSGGSGGRNATSDTPYGGFGTFPYMRNADVTPNTSYSITIGAGGTGGAGRTSGTQNGGVGGNTTFGALLTFAGGAIPSSGIATAANVLGQVSCNAVSTGYGGGIVYSGYVNFTSTQATTSGSYTGGFSGGPGYTGSVPGAGGNANNAGTGANGTNATGFGAGGGTGGGGSTAGGSGGNGAPGQLWVIWVE